MKHPHFTKSTARALAPTRPPRWMTAVTALTLCTLLAACGATAPDMPRPTWVPSSAPTTSSTAGSVPAVDNTARGNVEGGVAALPVLDVTVSGTVPKGWTRRQMDGVRYAVPTGWSEISSSRKAAMIADAWHGYDVTPDQVTTIMLTPQARSDEGGPGFFGFSITNAAVAADASSWSIPDFATSWRLDVPGAGLCGVNVVAVADSFFVQVGLATSDGVFHNLSFQMPPSQGSETLARQFLESLSIA